MSAYRDALEVAERRIEQLQGDIAARDAALAEHKRVLSATDADLERVRGLLTETVARRRPPPAAKRWALVAVAAPSLVGAVAWAVVERTRAEMASAELAALAAQNAPAIVGEREPLEAAPCPSLRPSRRPACCAALRQNGAAAPAQQRSVYLAAAGACSAFGPETTDRAAFRELRAAMLDLDLPAACGP
jgi:hypothetical protein